MTPSFRVFLRHSLIKGHKWKPQTATHLQKVLRREIHRVSSSRVLNGRPNGREDQLANIRKYPLHSALDNRPTHDSNGEITGFFGILTETVNGMRQYKKNHRSSTTVLGSSKSTPATVLTVPVVYYLR